MAKTTVFDELSSTLSENERNELLKRIRRSANLGEDNKDAVYHQELSQSERRKLIVGNMKQLSVWARILIWLRSRITGRSAQDAFIHYQIKLIKKRIARRAPGITGFETRNLTPVFARTFYDLYLRTTPLQSIFIQLWNKEAVFEAVFTNLLEKRISGVKKHLVDLIPMADLVEAYTMNPSKSGLGGVIQKFLANYINEIDAAVFTDLELKIQPLFYIKDIVLYPYVAFFQLFGVTPGLESNPEKIYFKGASANLALADMERLYIALYIASRIPDPLNLDESLISNLAQLVRVTAEEREAAQEPGGGAAAETAEKYADHLHYTVRELIKSAKRMMRNMPLLDLIRYFTRDPYYRLSATVPRLYLKEFYTGSLKIRFMAELDEIYPAVQLEWVERETAAIFKGIQNDLLRHYRKYDTIDYDKLGIPVFHYIRSLNLLHHYLKFCIDEALPDVCEILQQNVLSQDRLTKDRILRFMSGVTETRDKIQQFDATLSPEDDEGKFFQRLRFAMATDSSQLRMYRTLIIHKDNDAKELLRMGEENLAGLAKVLDEIYRNPSENIQNQLKTHYYIKSRSQDLESVLSRWVEQLEKFLRLISQVKRIDKG